MRLEDQDPSSLEVKSTGVDGAALCVADARRLLCGDGRAEKGVVFLLLLVLHVLLSGNK